MRAKFLVTGVEVQRGADIVKFTAVGPTGTYPEDGSDEDNSYAKWSPSADLQITIANPALFGKLRPGQKFHADFSEAPE